MKTEVKNIPLSNRIVFIQISFVRVLKTDLIIVFYFKISFSMTIYKKFQRKTITLYHPKKVIINSCFFFNYNYSTVLFVYLTLKTKILRPV